MTLAQPAGLIGLAFFSAIGLNILFWTLVGTVRWVAFVDRPLSWRWSPRFSTSDVAVVIPAFNEENALPACLAAALRNVPGAQIYVGDDSSTDQTASVARALGCNVHTAERNMGKARILDATISHFSLCDCYRIVLILDADSELDVAYLKYGLSQFDRPNVAVVAGHVVSRSPIESGMVARLINAYRSRLYATIQTFVKFGQTWHYANVTYIAPGFASMYRTDALKRINIVAPGLVIEDFNMTFEVHQKHLGEVAYCPSVICSTEDPSTLIEYSRQVRRWYLGFWQTLRKQRFWLGKFWLALSLVVLESVAAALFTLALPIMLVWSFADYNFDNPLQMYANGEIEFSPEMGIVLFLAADLLMTCFAAAILQRPMLLIYGLAFPFVRTIDAYWFLATLWEAFTVNSDGRWQSPSRAVRKGKA